VNEHSILVDMTKNMVKSGNILHTLKENKEDNTTTIKQVYNARYSYKISARESRTELQLFFYKLMSSILCDHVPKIQHLLF